MGGAEEQLEGLPRRRRRQVIRAILLNIVYVCGTGCWRAARCLARCRGCHLPASCRRVRRRHQLDFDPSAGDPVQPGGQQPATDHQAALNRDPMDVMHSWRNLVDGLGREQLELN